MRGNRIERRVYHSDTIPGRDVYYANYLKWFEVGRAELLRQLGFDYNKYEKRGNSAPVVEVKCDYKGSAEYDDVIIIKTNVGNIGKNSIKFKYEILRKKDNKLLVDGYTVHVFINTKKRKHVEVPEELREKLKDQ